MTRFEADGFPWADIPPTWHDPRTAADGLRQSPEANGARNATSSGAPAVPAGDVSPLPGRDRGPFLRDVAGYVLLIGGYLALVWAGGWLLSIVGGP